jgi:putative two-component system response regulator
LRGHVLIVDDEEANRRLFGRLLSRDGYDVEIAASGDEAVAAIERQPPDLVLLDVRMPGEDGFKVCRRLKSQARTRLIPVVLVTSLTAREDRIRGIEAGADDFLSKPVDREELSARIASLIRVKQYTDQLESAESIILSLARKIEARDVYTQGHCDRLARLARAFGQDLGLKEDELAALHRGAFLHDIGKIGVPDTVLLKTGPLDPGEYDQMKEHTVIGDGLCGTLQSLEMVRPIVRHHHERLDGSGYPDGLKGGDVPLLAQVVSIVDAYDAMTTNRPYHSARSPDAAYDELMDEAGRGWRDPQLVTTFVALGRSGRLMESVTLASVERGA